jgi:hypothetical protein
MKIRIRFQSKLLVRRSYKPSRIGRVARIFYHDFDFISDFLHFSERFNPSRWQNLEPGIAPTFGELLPLILNTEAVRLFKFKYENKVCACMHPVNNGGGIGVGVRLCG